MSGKESFTAALFHLLQHMLNRIPRLTADSPWEAKAIAVIHSIDSQQVSFSVSIGMSLHLLHVTPFLCHGSTFKCLSFYVSCV